MSAPAAVIRTEALTKVYPGDLRAVDGLDLEVHEGEIFGLLGPNGAGKTTTVGMLTTRVIPTSGRATVGGIDVWAHPSLTKQVIGALPKVVDIVREVGADLDRDRADQGGKRGQRARGPVAPRHGGSNEHGNDRRGEGGNTEGVKPRPDPARARDDDLAESAPFARLDADHRVKGGGGTW